MTDLKGWCWWGGGLCVIALCCAGKSPAQFCQVRVVYIELLTRSAGVSRLISIAGQRRGDHTWVITKNVYSTQLNRQTNRRTKPKSQRRETGWLPPAFILEAWEPSLIDSHPALPTRLLLRERPANAKGRYISFYYSSHLKYWLTSVPRTGPCEFLCCWEMAQMMGSWISSSCGPHCVSCLLLIRFFANLYDNFHL